MKTICNVCGKEADCSSICSCFGAESYAICPECLASGKEPYKSMVHYIACAGKFPEEINHAYRAIVRRQLEVHGVSEEKFIKDVDNCINEMYAFYH